MTNIEEGMLGTLRSMQENDLEMVLAWRNHSNVRKKMYNQHVISWKEHKKWWSKVSQSESESYFIYENTNPTGVVCFSEITHVHRRANWGIYASPQASKGVGTCMGILSMDYAFNEMRLQKVCCEVLSFNERALNLYKKLGFNEDGMLRSHINIKNEMENIFVLSIFARDWDTKRQAIIRNLIRRS